MMCTRDHHDTTEYKDDGWMNQRFVNVNDNGGDVHAAANGGTDSHPTGFKHISHH